MALLKPSMILSVCVGLLYAAAALAAPLPNVLLPTVDALRSEVSASGNGVIQTPNLDRIAAREVSTQARSLGATFSGTLAAFLLLTAIFWVVERPASSSRNRPQAILRRGWLTDVIYLFGTTLVIRPLVRLLLVVPLVVLVLWKVGSPAEFKAGAYRGFGPLSRQPVWLQALQIYLLVDFCGYWIHRLFHQGRWWPFHAVHHSSEALDWLGSVRVHPVNEIVNKLAQVTPVLLLGYNPGVTLAAAPVLTLYAIFLHANVNWDFGPLRCILASPAFHRWHHSREREAWDTNFAGLLPLWDILFGTYYMPRNRFPQNFGICEPMPDGYLEQLWEPLGALLRRQKKVDPEGPGCAAP